MFLTNHGFSILSIKTGFSSKALSFVIWALVLRWHKICALFSYAINVTSSEIVTLRAFCINVFICEITFGTVNSTLYSKDVTYKTKYIQHKILTRWKQNIVFKSHSLCFSTKFHQSKAVKHDIMKRHGQANKCLYIVRNSA